MATYTRCILYYFKYLLQQSSALMKFAAVLSIIVREKQLDRQSNSWPRTLTDFIKKKRFPISILLGVKCLWHLLMLMNNFHTWEQGIANIGPRPTKKLPLSEIRIWRRNKEYSEINALTWMLLCPARMEVWGLVEEILEPSHGLDAGQSSSTRANLRADGASWVRSRSQNLKQAISDSDSRGSPAPRGWDGDRCRTHGTHSAGGAASPGMTSKAVSRLHNFFIG